jgi:hypothetical protein
MNHIRGVCGMIRGIHGVRGVSGDGIHGDIRGIIPGIITIGTIDALIQPESIIMPAMMFY